VQKRAGNKLKLIGIGKDFIQQNSNDSTTKKKDLKMGLYQIKRFLYSKKNGYHIEEAEMGEWEKIFANDTVDK
jgi:hypothetical protein